VSKKPEDLEKEGGASEVLVTKGIQNIHIDKKLFVAMDKDQRIVSAGESGGGPSEDSTGAVPEEIGAVSSDDRRTGTDRRVIDDLDHLAKGDPERRNEEQRKQKVLQIQNGINSMLKGDDKVFMDSEIMRSLPPTILRMFSQGKEKNALVIINKLCKELLNKKNEIRAQVSVVLAHISIRFMTDNRIDDMAKLIPGLIEWIKFETIVSSAYKHICVQLKGTARRLILNRQFPEGNQILEPFHLIYSGSIKMTEETKKIAGELIKGVAAKDVLNLLLDELNKGGEDLKEQAINTLVLLSPWSTAFLLDILKKLPESKSPDTLKEKVRLQEYICTALGRIGSKKSIPALNLILERKDPLNTGIYNKEVQGAAKNALEMIKQGHTKNDEVELPSKGTAEPPEKKGKTEPAKTESTDNEASERLKTVDNHVKQGDTESAVKLLFDMIVKYAKQKDFDKADLLRDKLLEVNPMALTEIVKAGEVIEEERSAGIDQERLKAWSELYDKLNQAETHAVYFAMKSAEYNENKTVFQQGESNSRLYFINKGKIKLITNENGKEMLIKELGTGDIFGQETFFSLTVCTISAITISKVELDFLEKDIVTKWEKDIPGLTQKINDHCLKLEKTSEALKKQGRSRRVYERVNLSGRISMWVLDPGGSPVGESTTGNLADISIGGLSFFIKASKEKADKMFLDQGVNIKFNIKAGDLEHKVEQNGMVVGMIPHLYDYSVHIKFDNLLDDKIIQSIKDSAGSEDEELDILTDP